MGEHVLKLINPNLTDEDIEKYYRDTEKALDDIRIRRLQGEARSMDIVLD